MSAGASHSFDLLVALVVKEFKVRYKNTALGFLWSLANPIFFAVVFFTAFKTVLKMPMENYVAFLLAGLFPWQWFAGSLQNSTNVFIMNASLVKKVYLPRLLLPMSVTGNHLLHFCLALLVAVPVLAVNGIYPTLMWLPGIPLLILIQAVLTLGFSFIFSSVNVFFRDLDHLTGILVNVLFYLTPVLYPESLIRSNGAFLLFRLNPMYWIIPSWRSLVLHGTLDWAHLGWGAAGAAAVFVAGWFILQRLEWRFAECI